MFVSYKTSEPGTLLQTRYGLKEPVIENYEITNNIVPRFTVDSMENAPKNKISVNFDVAVIKEFLVIGVSL